MHLRRQNFGVVALFYRFGKNKILMQIHVAFPNFSLELSTVYVHHVKVVHNRIHVMLAVMIFI